METSIKKLHYVSTLIHSAKFQIRGEVQYDIHREIYARLKLEEALKIIHELEEK